MEPGVKCSKKVQISTALKDNPSGAIRAWVCRETRICGHRNVLHRRCARGYKCKTHLIPMAMVAIRSSVCSLFLIVGFLPDTRAQVPQVIHVQGHLSQEHGKVSGFGEFKFSLVNRNGS